MDEVIRAIEQAEADNIQDLMQAAMGRYRELYPQWRILFLAANPNDTDKRNRKFLKLISQAEKISGIGK